MGMHIYSDICNNVVQLGRYDPLSNAVVAEENDFDLDIDYLGIDILGSGEDKSTRWVVTVVGEAAGAHGNLSATELTKGDKKVYFVNSDEYANGGGIWYVLFGNDKPAVQAWLQDAGLPESDFPIGALDSVMQQG